jgi:hypothetical protein
VGWLGIRPAPRRGCPWPPASRADRRLGARILRSDAIEHAGAFGIVERVIHLLAHIDAVQRRHRDINVPGEHQRPEVSQEQRAQQRRNVQAVGVRVRENADLVVAQALELVGARIDAERDRDVMHFLRLQHFGGFDFPGVEDLAA